jgi:site-specific recombinase XerD
MPLVPERSDFLEGEEPVATKVEAFLASALAASAGPERAAHALVPWMCDVLLSKHSLEAYGRDLVDFVRQMEAQGVGPLRVTADHVKLYKRALLEAGMATATVARKLSVLRGTYKQLAAKGLVDWETTQDIAAIQAPKVQKNSTPSLTQKQAIQLLEAIPTDTLQGARDFALSSVFFLTGCRVSAVTSARVGDLETDGVEHYLHVTEKRGKRSRKILLDAARAVLIHLYMHPVILSDLTGPFWGDH